MKKHKKKCFTKKMFYKKKGKIHQSQKLTLQIDSKYFILSNLHFFPGNDLRFAHQAAHSTGF
jgi:hypothetical protein